MGRWTVWSGGQYGAVDSMERWTVWSGGLYGAVDSMERWTVLGGGQYEVVNSMERWTVWSGVQYGRWTVFTISIMRHKVLILDISRGMYSPSV